MDLPFGIITQRLDNRQDISWMHSLKLAVYLPVPLLKQMLVTRIVKSDTILLADPLEDEFITWLIRGKHAYLHLNPSEKRFIRQAVWIQVCAKYDQ